MDDVERLFKGLVEVLRDTAPESVRTPFQVSELYQSIIPYRTHKRRLGFDTNEDYEMAMLRLLAGEGGFAAVEPAEVQTQLEHEAGTANPNPGAFREFAAARVMLNMEAVRAVTRTAASYAPPPPPPPPPPSGAGATSQPDADPAAAFPAPAGATDATTQQEPPWTGSLTDAEPILGERTCPHCTELLPDNPVVHYCPFCGQRVGTVSCSHCGTEIETGWRYCVTCGKPA
jgi:hypothetical protein